MRTKTCNSELRYHDLPKINNANALSCASITYVGVFALLTGAVLSPFSVLLKQRSVEFVNVDMDFVPIFPNCTVTDVSLVESRQRKCSVKQGGMSAVHYDCGCEDVYSYSISAPLHAGVSIQHIGRFTSAFKFDSRFVELRRKGRSCKSGNVAPPLWDRGEYVKCWGPLKPGTKGTWAKNCENEECIQLFPPADDAAYYSRSDAWIGGSLALVISLLIFSVFVLKEELKQLQLRERI